VTINAKTAKDGYVVAEVLDIDNQPIPGFGRDDCTPFSGDSTRHVIEWKAKTFPEGLADKDKKIRFILRKADLYSYLPEALAK